MIQYFDESGRVHPGTVIAAGPVVVTQVKSKDTDGYDAVQVGYLEQKKERVGKAELGHTKGVGYKHLAEFRLKSGATTEAKVGDVLDIDLFAAGDKVTATGVSKGKGFQGVVKRHGFHGGPRSHGQKHSEREHGSIGGGLRNRVPKGMRMGGRMGSDTVTAKNLKIIDIDAGEHMLVIKGAIPGRKGSLVKIFAQ